MTKRNAIRMRDVAEELGVSTQTVSLALRNDPSLPETTRARVRETAKKMGYKPNPMISTLMAQMPRTGSETPTATIGVLHGHASQAESPSFTYLPGIEERALELGFRIDHFFTKQPGMSGKRLGDILVHRGIRALILPRRNWGHQHLNWEHFCAVTHGYTLVRPNLTRVSDNHLENARLALRHCRKLGYRRPGLVLNWHMNRSLRAYWPAALHQYQQRLPRKNQIPMMISRTDATAMPEDVFTWYRRHQPDVILYAKA